MGRAVALWEVVCGMGCARARQGLSVEGGCVITVNGLPFTSLTS